MTEAAANEERANAGMLLVDGHDWLPALTACGNPEKSTDAAVSAGSNTELNAEIKPATQYTIDANQQVYALLDFEDTAELENAKRGFLAAPDTLDLHDENGKAVWTQNAYAFLTKMRLIPQIPAFGGMHS